MVVSRWVALWLLAFNLAQLVLLSIFFVSCWTWDAANSPDFQRSSFFAFEEDEDILPLPHSSIAQSAGRPIQPGRGRRKVCATKGKGGSNSGSSNETVVFVSGHAAFPQCIEAQYKLLRKFYKGDFRYLAYLDDRNHEWIFSHTDVNSLDQLLAKCAEQNIPCRVFPKELHRLRTLLHPATEEPYKDESSLHPSDLIQWSLQEEYCHEGPFVNLDADLILTAETDREDLMRGKAFRYMQQFRGCADIRVKKEKECEIRYAWNTMMALDLKSLPNLDEFSMDCGKVCTVDGCDSVDTGGKSHWFISSLPDDLKGTIRQTDFNATETYPDIPAFRAKVFELFEHKWLHLRNGGHTDPNNLNRFDNGRICEEMMKRFAV
uniref:Uncharacterized protein n=1 Tax=Chromera velia CCMP2878 TaxID=1169474 RepID=A0A0G4FWU6_9ALVE|eukprot:Cvel_19174.t1-p1 / transcript=Cvel_19174.t1 / gene=Cvel_19174 / organism=Chromera_velia_CCMP2878 / gene_product=hypothetical protein / transcript_product=hypothetical protein / location=Cvel_scaffold1634:11200-13000(+) / protein_length=375 / sequence_SO=supercontig / SO=protein_coding / is_pseudo=false